MLQVGFVTCATVQDLTPDDQLAFAELAARDVTARPVLWDDPSIEWQGFDALVLRSTWDYHHRSAEFRAWLDRIEAAGARLFNPPATVRWNMHKRYLANLAERGLPVVPTAWLEQGETADLYTLMKARGWERAVVKPAISASAHNTWTTTGFEAPDQQARLDDLLGRSDVLVQPFMEEVQTEGEWSLLFFGRQYSHAVLKRPAEGDFRVQNEYGGGYVAAQPEPETVAQAAAVLAAVEGPLVYARVDGVVRAGIFTLMELELIEPYLFLGTHPGAAARFAATILEAL
ncbi:MAG: hypothetical protein EPO32_12370 [Anaerolineae bacterium]|nr:MAG: hypothetical protein EPO32_12370 [Anaerolineae bacterium]